MRVYVSSTSLDLKEHRAAVIGALRKMQYTPVCMEDYVAQDVLPVEKCLSDVAQSDVYVGVFAWRYGFVPPGYDKSITELEYRKAVEASIPVLIFLSDEEISWPDDCKDTGDTLRRIALLREELKLSKMVSFFTNPHHLASEVQSAVSQVFMQKLMENRYAEVSVSRNSEQADSVERAVALLQEALKQQSRQF